jgi:uncharacterized protein YecA (UPF0149 family)
MNTENCKPVATALSPAQVKVAVALAGGLSISAAARETDISRTTIYDWLNNDAEFRSKYDILRQNLEDELKDQVLELRSMALARLRSLLENPDTPPAIQLRAALAVLKDTLAAPLNKTEQNLTPQTAAADKTEQIRTPARPEPAPSRQPQAPPEPATDRQEPVRKRSTPPNARCPCGSGKKFKRCCSNNAPPLANAA